MRTLLPIAGLVAVFCIAFFGEQGLMANHRLREQMVRLQAENNDLRDDNAALEEMVRGLREDPLAIEKTIREEMLMARPDEVVYTFRDKSDDDPAARDPETGGEAER